MKDKLLFKYVELSNQEKLQAFVELACYGTYIEKSHYCDASNPDNKKKAGEWFEEKLFFLSKRDAQELMEVWEYAIKDGSYTRTLFTAIKILQEKYAV